MSWPPKPSQLSEEEINLPDEVRMFLATLLTGNSKYPEEPWSSKVQRLVNSFGQDKVFEVTGGRKKPPKHILLPYAVNTLTNNVELIQILNRCGHGLAYSQIEEFNTAMCLQKKAMTPQNTVPFPDKIKPHISTSLAWNNIDRSEETLSGGGTSHRVNGIAIQARQMSSNVMVLGFANVFTGCDSVGAFSGKEKLTALSWESDVLHTKSYSNSLAWNGIYRMSYLCVSKSSNT